MRDVTETIGRAVETSLEGRATSRVLVRLTVDFEGQEALGVTIILGDADLSGSEALGMLVRIHEALTASGDDRFPIVEVTTENELALDGGPEP